jgi:hypothetical protein
MSAIYQLSALQSALEREQKEAKVSAIEGENTDEQTKQLEPPKDERLDGLDGLDKAQLEVEEFAQNIRERKKYARSIFWVILGWMVFVAGIIIACLWLFAVHKPILSDAVLITLLTTTTANVLGLFVLVVQYLFKK